MQLELLRSKTTCKQPKKPLCRAYNARWTELPEPLVPEPMKRMKNAIDKMRVKYEIIPEKITLDEEDNLSSGVSSQSQSLEKLFVFLLLFVIPHVSLTVIPFQSLVD